jgi:phenylacetic acid degradation protein paaN
MDNLKSQTNYMTLFAKHETLMNEAVKATAIRNYYTPYPEMPKAYAEDADAKAKAYISATMNNNFMELLQDAGEGWVGEEVSPYLQLGIGVKYPTKNIAAYIADAQKAHTQWSHLSVEDRAGLLIEVLDRLKARFFDIAYATMHTTGQSFMMSFQASGPHSNDRALEAVVEGYKQLTSMPANAAWVKPMGKFDLTINKNWKAVPKGVGMVIGCSTFPIWNTVPALFANLITGNATIVKPHPKAVLPIAIVVGEIQKLLKENNIDTNTVQLAADTLTNPVTKLLAENDAVKLVDYTGGSLFGEYVEGLKNKTVFTEKAGVNSIILDSAKQLAPVMQNIAFAASLYSGQMCTAPQNVFIPSTGVKTDDGVVSYEDAVKLLTDSIHGLVTNPKAGAPTLGAIQSDLTAKRLADSKNLGGKVLLESMNIKNEEFADARVSSPTVIELNRTQGDVFNHECFGPIVFIIKTDSTADSLALAKKLASEKGAITCGAYTTDKTTQDMIEDEMNSVFTPVSFNFTGAAFINSHAAFSDMHVTGGNPAGNASLTSSEFIVKRFVWVGNRFM